MIIFIISIGLNYYRFYWHSKAMKVSRPNTAKKNMLSPKGHKNKSEREGKDLDVGQLCDAM